MSSVEAELEKQRRMVRRDKKEVIPLDMPTRHLMLAVETKKTLLNFGFPHFCVTHKFLVDKDHIDRCSHLISKEGLTPTHFNEVFEKTNLYDLRIDKLAELKNHFEQLMSQLRNLELQQTFCKVFVERE